MKRILVPTDFSPTAEKAFRIALDIALKSKGEIFLYHAYTPVDRTTSINLDKKGVASNSHKEAGLMKRLERLKKKVMSDGLHVPVSIVLGNNPVIKNMLNVVSDKNIDLIVMGTQGASGLKKVIIGSVASSVIQKCDIPVLLIPEKCEWKEPGQVVFATNYHKTDRQAITLVIALAKYYNAKVTVTHLLNAKSMLQAEKEQTNFDTYAYTIQREFSNSKLKFQLVKTTAVTETMENLDKKYPYDILAMVRRKKSFFEGFFLESFTQNMAYVTRKPLLIIPEVK